MTRCWCGADNPQKAPLYGGCNGIGTVECLCGGDSCVCHHHGAAECDGCPECDPTVVIEEYDFFCHDSHAPEDDGSPAESRARPAPPSSLTK